MKVCSGRALSALRMKMRTAAGLTARRREGKMNRRRINDETFCQYQSHLAEIRTE